MKIEKLEKLANETFGESVVAIEVHEDGEYTIELTNGYWVEYVNWASNPYHLYASNNGRMMEDEFFQTIEEAAAYMVLTPRTK